MKKFSFEIAGAWICFIAGACIYLLFRSREHLGFCIIDAIGLGTLADSIRQSVAGITPPDFVRYCLPDGLWSTAYILFTDHIHRDSPARQRILWASIIPVIGFVSELMQAADLLPGTFDIYDLIVYVIPLIPYILIINHKN